MSKMFTSILSDSIESQNIINNLSDSNFNIDDEVSVYIYDHNINT